MVRTRVTSSQSQKMDSDPFTVHFDHSPSLPGSLEGIDALVGCALVLPEKAMLNVG